MTKTGGWEARSLEAHKGVNDERAPVQQGIFYSALQHGYEGYVVGAPVQEGLQIASLPLLQVRLLLCI